MLIHRPYFEHQSFAKLKNSDAIKAYEAMETEVRRHLQRKSIPAQVIDKLFSIPSNASKYLSQEEIDMLPKNAGFEELTYSRCRVTVDGKDAVSYYKSLIEERRRLADESAKYSPFRSKEEAAVSTALEAQREAVAKEIDTLRPKVGEFNECAGEERLAHQIRQQGVTPLSSEEWRQLMIEGLEEALDEARAKRNK